MKLLGINYQLSAVSHQLTCHGLNFYLKADG
jgi:hypothetical protein